MDRGQATKRASRSPYASPETSERHLSDVRDVPPLTLFAMSLTPSTLPLPDCLKNIKFPYDLARGAYFPNVIFLYPLPELLGNATLMDFVNTLATNKTAIYHNEAAFGNDINRCLDAFAMPKSTVVIPRYAPFIKTYNAETYRPNEGSDNLLVEWKANDFNLRTDLMTADEWLQIPAVLELRRRDEEKKAKARRESGSVEQGGDRRVTSSHSNGHSLSFTHLIPNYLGLSAR